MTAKQDGPLSVSQPSSPACLSRVDNGWTRPFFPLSRSFSACSGWMDGWHSTATFFLIQIKDGILEPVMTMTERNKTLFWLEKVVVTSYITSPVHTKLDCFPNGPSPASFSLISFFSNHFHNKTIDFSRIQTRIIRV